jgi:hypothetical protein
MTGFYLSGAGICGQCQECIHMLDMDIIDPVTSGTDEMLMRNRIPVIMFRAAAGGEAGDLTDFL